MPEANEISTPGAKKKPAIAQAASSRNADPRESGAVRATSEPNLAEISRLRIVDSASTEPKIQRTGMRYINNERVHHSVAVLPTASIREQGTALDAEQPSIPASTRCPPEDRKGKPIRTKTFRINRMLRSVPHVLFRSDRGGFCPTLPILVSLNLM